MKPRIDDIIDRVEARELAKQQAAEEQRLEKIARRQMVAKKLKQLLEGLVRPELELCQKRLDDRGWKVKLEDIHQRDPLIGDEQSLLVAVKLMVDPPAGCDRGTIEYRGRFDEETLVCSMFDHRKPPVEDQPKPFSAISEDSLALEFERFLEKICNL